jgi:preprotein translocase subunit SecD
MKFTDYLKDRRILVLIFIGVALAALDLHYGLHFGIEFVGGTQIPVTLEHSVNASAMSALITALQQRVSTFGLKEVTVEGIGSSEVYVIVPTVSESDINQTIGIIQSQGRFDGIVNGREALNGSDILKGSIGQLSPTITNNTVSWGVTFFTTQSASNNFAHVVFGDANKPLYMFLDRPTNTAIFINGSVPINSTTLTSQAAAAAAITSALAFGNQTIPFQEVYNTNSSVSNAERFLQQSSGKYKNIIASAGINRTFLSYLYANNYTVKLESRANMTPTFTQVSLNQTVLESWPIVGLLTAPVLNPSITGGNVSDSYEISGVAPTTLNKQQQLTYATSQTKQIASILSGGALPVAVIAGTPTTIPPTLGSHFLYISGLAGVLAIVFVSVFIVIRYKKMFLVVPILLTTMMELFIIVSIIGLIGTIDLAAVAGMIAVVGTGVDAQIIITDEIIARGSHQSSTKVLLGNAFYIVWADAALLVLAMLPLFFSTSLVSVIGFSESTIIGALLGVMITRPAYGAILSKHYSE